MDSYTIYRGEPIRLDVTIVHDFLSTAIETLTKPNVDVAAKVFRDFRDPSSLISVKRMADQTLLIPNEFGNPGRIEIQLKPEDVAEERPIFVAIYINGRMVDLFGVEIQPSPSSL
jgi:hypothetical protein